MLMSQGTIGTVAIANQALYSYTVILIIYFNNLVFLLSRKGSNLTSWLLLIAIISSAPYRVASAN